MTTYPVQHKRPAFLTMADKLMLLYATLNILAAGLLLMAHSVSTGLALWMGIVWTLVAATSILSRFTGELIANRLSARRIARMSAEVAQWRREVHSI